MLPENYDSAPKYVGTLNREIGLNGFEVAKPGHPVFETVDRFIFYLKSETLLIEKRYDPKLKDYVSVKEPFCVALPYYKDTLRPHIDFTEGGPKVLVQ